MKDWNKKTPSIQATVHQIIPERNKLRVRAIMAKSISITDKYWFDSG